MAGRRITVDVLGDGSLEPVLGANVLAFDVDVHEGRELVVLEQLPAQSGEAAHEVVEQLSNGAAPGLDLPRTMGLVPERGRDPDAAQCPTPEQNST